MPSSRPLLLALLLGPAGLWLAGQRFRALVAALALGVPLVAYGYLAYLQTWLAVDDGGTSAREITATSVRAFEAWLRDFPRWGPGAVGLLVVANLACAGVLWRGGATASDPAGSPKA